jgi:hypothetical protein
LTELSGVSGGDGNPNLGGRAVFENLNSLFDFIFDEAGVSCDREKALLDLV